MHTLAFVCVVLAIAATFASHTLKRPVRPVSALKLLLLPQTCIRLVASGPLLRRQSASSCCTLG